MELTNTLVNANQVIQVVFAKLILTNASRSRARMAAVAWITLILSLANVLTDITDTSVPQTRTSVLAIRA